MFKKLKQKKVDKLKATQDTMQAVVDSEQKKLYAVSSLQDAGEKYRAYEQIERDIDDALKALDTTINKRGEKKATGIIAGVMSGSTAIGAALGPVLGPSVLLAGAPLWASVTFIGLLGALTGCCTLGIVGICMSKNPGVKKGQRQAMPFKDALKTIKQQAVAARGEILQNDLAGIRSSKIFDDIKNRSDIRGAFADAALEGKVLKPQNSNGPKEGPKPLEI